MKAKAFLVVFLLTEFPSAMAFGQDLPIFDYENFEVVSVISNSRVHARSGGSDFYCFAMADENEGYVFIDGCLPFVGFSVVAQARAQALVEATAAAIAAEEAAAAVAADLARIVQNQDDDLAVLIGSVDESVFRSAVISVATRNGCQLYLNKNGVSNFARLQEIVRELGYLSQSIGPASVEATNRKFSEAAALLTKGGVAEMAQDGKLMKLKDCN